MYTEQLVQGMVQGKHSQMAKNIIMTFSEGISKELSQPFFSYIENVEKMGKGPK